MRLFNTTDDPKNLSPTGKLFFLVKDTFFYGGLRGINLLFPFATVPFLTRYFSVAEYGLYDSLMVVSGFISLLLVFGQDSAVARWYYQVEGYAEKRKVVTEALLIQLLFTIVIVPVLIIYHKPIHRFYYETDENSIFLVLVVLQSIGLLFVNYITNILKWTFARKKYAFFSFASPVLLFAALMLVIIFKLSLLDFMYLILLAGFITTVAGLVLIKKWLYIPRRLFFTKKLLAYGIPMGIICFSSAMLSAIDRKMIIYFLAPEDLGYYALAFKIATIVLAIDGVFQMAWGPFYLSVFKNNDSEKVFNIVLKFYVFIFMGLIFSLYFLSPPFISIYATDDYLASVDLILPLTFALFFSSFSGLTGIGIGLSLKSYLNIPPFIFTVAVLIVSLYYFTPLYGLHGVAYSFLLAYFIKFVSVSVTGHKVYKDIRMNYFLPAVMACLCLAFLYVLSISGLPLYIGLLSGVLVLGLVFIVLFSKDEISSMRSLFNKN